MRTVITIIMSLLALVSCQIGDEPPRYTVTYYDEYWNVYRQYDNLVDGSLLPVPEDPGEPFYGWVYYCMTDGVIDLSSPAGISEDEDGHQIVSFSMAAIPRGPDTTYVTYNHIFEEDLHGRKRTSEQFVEGETVTFKPIEVENFSLVGWYLDEELTIPVQEGDFIAQKDSFSLDLYAYYEATIPIITVTYDQEGIEPVRLLSGSVLKDHLDEPHVDGRFIAWYMDEDLTVRAYDDTSVETDTKLYARIIEAPQPISKVDSYYLFNTGEIFRNDMSSPSPVMDAVGSVLMTYDDYHYYVFMEEDGYYLLGKNDHLPGLFDDERTAYPEGIGRVVDSCGDEAFFLVLDSAGKLYLNGEFNGSSHGSLELFDAFTEDYASKAVRVETNGRAVGLLTDDGGLYILGFISNTSNPYINFDTFTKIADDVVDFAFTTSALLYVTEDGALEHRGIDLRTLDVDNRQIESSGVTSIYASMRGNDHNDFILYTKGDDVYVLGKYGINSTPKTYEKPTLLFEGYCKVTDFSRMPALFDAEGRLYLLGSLHDIQEDGYATVDEPYHVLPGVDFVSASSSEYGTYALSDEGDLWYFGATSSTYHQVREPFVVKIGITMLSSELAVAADGTVYRLENHAYLRDLGSSFASPPIALKEDYVRLEDGTVYRHTTGWSKEFGGELTDFFFNGTYFAAVDMNRLESNFVEDNHYYPYAFEHPIVEAVATENVELVLLDNGEVQWRGKGYRSASLEPLHDENEVLNQKFFTSLDTNVRFKDIMPVDFNDYGFFLLAEDGKVYYLGDTSWVKGGCYQVNGMHTPKDLFNAHVEIMKDGLFVSDECIYLEGTKNYEAQHRPMGEVRFISGGRTVKCILETGELYTWGTNYAGECGNGESSYPSTPVLVDLDQWRF